VRGEDVLETWIDVARGPVFRAALAFAVLGLVRHAVVTVSEMRRMFRRAGDKRVPYRQVMVATAKWLIPVERVRQRPLYSLTTLAFHVAIIVVPLFLAGHIALVRAGTGLAWPAIGGSLADVLTIVAISTAVLLVAQRATARDTRTLSRFQDYALPVVIAMPFVSGFLVLHPAWNPFPYDVTLLMHVVTADALLLLIPVTKLSHMVLLPATQLVGELAWHFPPNAGREVGAQLGRGEQPI
jgi:nitrate reductase gamma subunit